MIAVHRLGSTRPGPLPPRNPSNRGARANLEGRRGLIDGRSRLNRTDHPFTQLCEYGFGITVREPSI